MWDEKNITDQTNRTIIITGAKVGLGFETALALYKAGANVVITCRDKKKASDTCNKLKKINGKGNIESGILDLSDLESVKQFAENFLAKHNRLDVLINNAGVAM